MLKASNRSLDQRLLWLLLTVSGVLLLHYYYEAWALALQAPFSLGEEGPAMWAAQMLSVGANPYSGERLVNHPWAVTAYPPLYFYIGSWFFKITGAHFYPLRWLSMVAFIVSQVASYRIFTLSGCSRFARLLGLITTASFFTFWAFSFKARVDMVALCLIILAVEQYLVLARKPKDDNIFRFPRLVVIASLITLATITKQGSILVVPAIAAALIVGRQWRLSLFFMWLCTLLISCSVFVINKLTAGGFMAHEHFVALQRFATLNLLEHLGWLGSDGIILLFALFAAPIYVIGYFNRQEERDGPYRQHFAALTLVSVLLMISMCNMCYSFGKPYATVSDAMVPMFAAAWLVALASDFMRRRLLLLLFLAFGAGFYVINDMDKDLSDAVSSMMRAREFINSTRFDRSLILSEDCGLPLELGGNPEFVDLPRIMAVRGQDGKLLEEVRERVAGKGYGAVVINSRDGCLLQPTRYWDRSFIKTIKQAYEPKQAFKADGRPEDFYLPRPGNSHRPD